MRRSQSLCAAAATAGDADGAGAVRGEATDVAEQLGAYALGKAQRVIAELRDAAADRCAILVAGFPRAAAAQPPPQKKTPRSARRSLKTNSEGGESLYTKQAVVTPTQF